MLPEHNVPHLDFNLNNDQSLLCVLLCFCCSTTCVCSSWFFITFAQIIALSINGDKECDQPLFSFIIVRFSLHLQNTYKTSIINYLSGKCSISIRIPRSSVIMLMSIELQMFAYLSKSTK